MQRIINKLIELKLIDEIEDLNHVCMNKFSFMKGEFLCNGEFKNDSYTFYISDKKGSKKKLFSRNIKKYYQLNCNDECLFFDSIIKMLESWVLVMEMKTIDI